MDTQEKIVSPAVQKTGSLDSTGIVMCINYGDEQSKSTPYGFCLGERSIRKLEVNGFMTSTGRFVDAKEAWRIAKDADQVNPLFVGLDFSCHPELKPEDLY